MPKLGRVGGWLLLRALGVERKGSREEREGKRRIGSRLKLIPQNGQKSIKN